MPALTLPPFTPHAGQQLLLAARRKRNVARMGRRWGKTHLLTEVLINRPGGALAGCDGHGRQGLPCAWYAPNDAYFSRVFLEIARQYAATIRRDPALPPRRPGRSGNRDGSPSQVADIAAPDPTGSEYFSVSLTTWIGRGRQGLLVYWEQITWTLLIIRIVVDSL